MYRKNFTSQTEGPMIVSLTIAKLIGPCSEINRLIDLGFINLLFLLPSCYSWGVISFYKMP